MVKTLYFTDFMAEEDQIESEIEDINKLLRENKLDELIVKKSTTEPPFKGHSQEIKYDVMFFDYGGAMDMCYSTVSNYIECILRESVECPNRYYVVTSTFSMLLNEFKDIVRSDFGNNIPFNVFLSIQDFMEYWKKYEKPLIKTN
jgi:hypothetical protein